MIEIDKEGILEIGGVKATTLVEKFGTPLMVMDRETIENNIDKFKNSIEENYDGNGMMLYASKAFCCKEMYRILKRKNVGADIVSLGELYTALSVDFDPQKLVFHGNNKTVEDIVQAIEHGVGRIIIDSKIEAERVIEIASKLNKRVNVMIRVNPGIEVHTHDYIKTGQVDSKFGIAIDSKDVYEVIKLIINSENVFLKGIHAHIGSQIFELKPFEDAVVILLNFIKNIKEKFGFTVKELNFGGGFGIRYTKEDKKIPFEMYLEKIAAKLNKECPKLGLEKPYIYIEPGRSVVGEAGVTLYRAGTIKKIPGIRTYVSIDGGMTDNPRYALYKSVYEISVATKMHEDKNKVITLAGRCCESGDLIGENMKVQDVEVGDIIAVFSTGAYNYSMSSHYNRLPKPPVVMPSKGKCKLIIKGETFADVYRNDI